MKTVIVIPTYNERENITKLIPAILARRLNDVEYLVVDDNSPDGTAGAVRALQAQYPDIHLLVRQQKEGLGKAYVAGFQSALGLGAELIVEMDADFSHDPGFLPTLINPIIEDRADVVLGSRYVAGGGVRNWNVVRRAISRFGNVYARTILGLPYQDLTGGFKAYRRSALETVLASDLSSVGYNFQIETTYRAHQAGVRIVETPIIFTERQVGTSKFSLKILLESFWKVLRLRLIG